jgi:hypothetical protein
MSNRHLRHHIDFQSKYMIRHNPPPLLLIRRNHHFRHHTDSQGKYMIYRNHLLLLIRRNHSLLYSLRHLFF